MRNEASEVGRVGARRPVRYAVVIPAYNEAATLREVVREVLRYCDQLIVVDDGSSDGTAATVADLSITLLRHETNQGKAASLWNGMQAALERGAEAVITLDADGQHRAQDIPRFLEAAAQHPEQIVIGSRLADKHAFPPKRYYANKVACFWISWAAGYRIEDSQSGFRLYPAGLLRRLRLPHDPRRSFVFESEVLIEAARHGVRSVPVPIAAVYQPGARPSHFRGVADITLITRMVAWKLISRGMYPQGLVRAFLVPRVPLRAIGGDGLAMLLLANVVLLASAGTTLLWQLGRAWRLAAGAATSCDPPPDWCLVLGMRLQRGEVSPAYAERLERARRLYRQAPHMKILVLGGHTSRAPRSEAEAGRDYLVDRGVPAECIVLEHGSRHTLENLRNARELLGQAGRLALITNRYHLPRSHAMAEGLRLRQVPCAAEERWRWRPANVLRLLKEAYLLHWYVVGRAWSRLTGNKAMLGRIS